ncbi:transposase [Streptomyces decoyicus]|uniref:RNA-guided endonuclease InsQ/TnpB family protein n=1 Tax=Streptomyces decoyicus TaxID=249567 RepID=UPI002F906A37
MHLRYNFRLYPTQRQRSSLANVFGCARVVFNDALAARKAAYGAGNRHISDGDLLKLVTTQAKRTPEREWLREAPAAVLQQAVSDLNTAYRNYFNSIAGKFGGVKIGHPRFRSRKDNRQAVRYTRNTCFKVTASGKLRLPKVGDVHVRWSRRLPSDPSSVTIVKDAAGRYFASFVVQTDPSEALPETTGEIGIDLGLTHFAVLSDGRKESSPKFLRRAERKLRKAQKALSRKEKGSNNRKKAATRVARLHAQVADARRDNHHKLSTKIIRENQAVYVENLNVVGLARTRMGKSVRDAGWSMFVNMLEYKATRYGRTFQRVDRRFPSSQICSACGVKDGPKPLNVRTWMCQDCDTMHDRDVNAARNILNEGKRIVAAGHADTENACGAQVRPVLVPAQRSESGSRPKSHPSMR